MPRKMLGMAHLGARTRFHMLHRWRGLVPEGLVLDQIANGHQIPFKDGIIPPCTGIVETRLCSGAESQAIDSELENLLSKGAVTRVSPQERGLGYYSTCFLVEENRLPQIIFTGCVKAALRVLIRNGTHLAWFLDGL